MNAFIRFTLALCSTSLLAGCGENIDHRDIHSSGFVYCGESAPSTFNPQLVENDITSHALSPQLYDTLLTIDSDTHLPKASLAKQWTVNPSHTEYIFTLRPDVTFQTTAWFTPTRPLNADDVVFSFKRIIDPSHPYHTLDQVQYPWFQRIDFQDLLLDVIALDDLTVKFVLRHADNSFLSNIATTHAVILSQEYANQLLINDEKNQLDTQPVGSGPFYLAEYHARDLVRLKRHTGYWNGVAKLEQVVFDISQRSTGMLAKLLRNECDVLQAPISSHLPAIEKNQAITLTTTPAMNVAFIAVKTQHPALRDSRVRKALNFAINRQNILDSIYYGTGSIAFTILPPTSWAYQQDAVQIHYDRNYALALLREAGFATGLELTLLVPPTPKAYNPSPSKTAELIQANLADIGIKLRLINEERSEYQALSERPNIDLFLTGWTADNGDPDNFLRPLLSCDSNQAGLNVAMWCNDDFDELLDLAREANNPRYRLNLYHQAQHLLNQEFPVIPLTHGIPFIAYHQSLTGVHLSPFNVLPFNTVERVTE